MKINQQMHVKTIDEMVGLTSADIVDKARYKQYRDYSEFVSHYKSQSDLWVANLTEKQKKLFCNYIREGVKKPGNYAAVNGLARGNLIDRVNRKIEIRNSYTTDKPFIISFDEFEKDYLPIQYEGRSITTIEKCIDMQYDSFNELNNVLCHMKPDEDTILYRGINLNAFYDMTDSLGNNIGIKQGDSLETIYKKIKFANIEYIDKGFMSASPVPVEITTSKDIILKLKCKKGVSGVDMTAVGGYENEYLLSANQVFDIIGYGIEEIDGKMKNVLYLESK